MMMRHVHAHTAPAGLRNSTACGAVVDEVVMQEGLEYPQGARHVRCVITWAEAEKAQGEKRMAEASEVEKCRSAEAPLRCIVLYWIALSVTFPGVSDVQGRPGLWQQPRRRRLRGALGSCKKSRFPCVAGACRT